MNSLVLNSGYSVLYAAQQFKDEGASSEAYGKMDTDEMLRIVKASRGRPESDYISEKIPTLTKNQATYQGKPKNIVIILEESFGAQFVGTLGGKPLSPEFDKLAKKVGYLKISMRQVRVLYVVLKLLQQVSHPLQHVQW